MSFPSVSCWQWWRNTDLLSWSCCLCLSDQRDGRPRRNPGRFGQPGAGQPHRPHPASDRSRLCTRSQTVSAADPSWSREPDGQASVFFFFSRQRGGRPWPRRGSGLGGGWRTVLQSHEAERRGGHCAEVNALPEVWGRRAVLTSAQNRFKGFSLDEGVYLLNVPGREASAELIQPDRNEALLPTPQTDGRETDPWMISAFTLNCLCSLDDPKGSTTALSADESL